MVRYINTVGEDVGAPKNFLMQFMVILWRNCSFPAHDHHHVNDVPKCLEKFVLVPESTKNIARLGCVYAKFCLCGAKPLEGTRTRMFILVLGFYGYMSDPTRTLVCLPTTLAHDK